MLLTTDTLIDKKEVVQIDYSKQQKEKKIILKEKCINHFIRLDTITYLMCDCYLTTVHTDTGDSYVIAKLLKEFEEELTPYGFVRGNRNVIINITHIRSCRNSGTRRVQLTNNISIDISRRGMGRLREAVGL